LLKFGAGHRDVHIETLRGGVSWPGYSESPTPVGGFRVRRDRHESLGVGVPGKRRMLAHWQAVYLGHLPVSTSHLLRLDPRTLAVRVRLGESANHRDRAGDAAARQLLHSPTTSSKLPATALAGARARAVLTEALPALNLGQWQWCGSVTTMHTTNTLCQCQWLLLCSTTSSGTTLSRGVDAITDAAAETHIICQWSDMVEAQPRVEVHEAQPQ
jgi:hypothetical protein